VQELTERELASREDGLVSAVDLQILAWMIQGQRSAEERAFNRTAFQKLGGLEGLLERFLSRALQVRETEARRQAALKVLLALTDLERNVRAGVLSAEDVEKKLAGTVSPEEVQEALEWLARGDVRLVTAIERETARSYELAHERLIPALRRLAGTALSAADQANQLLDQRVNEWLGNHRARRYLLTGREWRLVQRQRPFLVWGANQSQKEALLAQTQRYWRRCAGAALLVALLFVFPIGWWHSSWGQIWQVKRDIESLTGRIDNETAHDVALAWYKAGDFEQARQTAEGIHDPDSKARALSKLAVAAAKIGDPAKAAVLIEQARQTVEGIHNPNIKARALGDLAENYARLGDWYRARQMAELNNNDIARANDLATILEVWAERRNPALTKVGDDEEYIRKAPALLGKG
jgi:hypothetical protein